MISSIVVPIRYEQRLGIELSNLGMANNADVIDRDEMYVYVDVTGPVAKAIYAAKRCNGEVVDVTDEIRMPDNYFRRNYTP